MMKNKISVTILIVLAAALLAACGGTAQGAEAEAVTQVQGGDFTGEMSALNRLMMGLLYLEEGEQPLTAQQAEEMLPLWKLAGSMNETSNVASEELDALAEQLSASLNDEQRTAIGEMEITFESQRELMQELGLSLGGGQSGEGPPEGFQRPDGGVPGSGPGAGGGAGGTGLSPDQIATMQAGRAGVSRSGLNPMLLETLIERLEEKAGTS